MDETPILGIPFAEGTDPADAPAMTEPLAIAVEELLLNIPATQIVGGAEADLLVVQGTGAAAFKAMSGDITIDKTGKASIGLLKVITGMLADLAITSSKIDNSAVITEKIANLAVTAAKIANGAIETGKLANLAVTSAILGPEAVLTEKLKNLAVTAAKIAEATITAAKLANNAVTAEKIIAGAITETKLGDGSVTSRKFKPTGGDVEASENLALAGAYANVPGALLKITPVVASILKVEATWDLEIHPNGGISQALGTLSVDGVDQEREANFLGNTINNVQLRGTKTQTYRLALTAAEHTIRMRAAKPLGAEACICYADDTHFTYELVAS